MKNRFEVVLRDLKTGEQKVCGKLDSDNWHDEDSESIEGTFENVSKFLEEYIKIWDSQ